MGCEWDNQYKMLTISFQQKVPGLLDIDIQKNEFGPFAQAIYKN